jgi:hypothetical protein
MAIPKYDDIMPAAIEYLSENGLSRYRDIGTATVWDILANGSSES